MFIMFLSVCETISAKYLRDKIAEDGCVLQWAVRKGGGWVEGYITGYSTFYLALKRQCHEISC